MALLLSALATGCGGGKDPILGGGGTVALAPTVTAAVPANDATGVPIDDTIINVTFSEPMAAIAAGTGFTVTCAAPCVSPIGTVTLDATSRIATFTPAATTGLAPLTLYSATITGAQSLATGLALASPYVWHFTTGEGPAVTRPGVTSTAPVTTVPGPTTGVPTNTAIAAAFTRDMAPATIIDTTFSVTCAAPCVSPTGVVSYVGSSRTAVFTPMVALAPSTTYTATITVAATDLAGNALGGNQAALPAASDYVWTFTTGATPDTTRPRVTLTIPATTDPGPTAGVPTNTTIVAIFTENMAPTMISGTSFTVTCVAPCVSPSGNVTYAVGSRTAGFAPAAPLEAGATYTATITTAATDLAGNALAGNQAALPAASDYVWTFTTAAALPAANVSVLSTNPAAGAIGVCPTATLNATFDVPSGSRMNPLTVDAATFTVTGPAPALTPVIAASVVLDAPTGLIATFTPQSVLTVGGIYTATLTGGGSGVRDLVIPANEMVSDFTWSFTVGPATGNCLAPVALGSVTPFGTFGGSAGMTNTGIWTVIDGDIGTTNTEASSVTGFHDTGGDIYTESPLNIGAVTGLIYSCTVSTTGPTSGGLPNPVSCAIAAQARLDAQAAYLALVGLPPGANPGANLAGLTLAPGVYTAPDGSFEIQGGQDLTLDAQGNADAVWVFQMASTLTVGGAGAPRSIILAGGAQAKNVFWQVGSAATINAAGGGTMVGTIIAAEGAAFSTADNVAIVTLEGRALSLGASVTLVNTIINVPAP